MADRIDAATAEWFCERLREMLPELYGTARRLTGADADAEDLVADAVARAWGSLHGLERRDALRGWIFRILNNVFISQRRARSARPVHEPFEEELVGNDEAFSIFERLHQPFLLWWGNPEKDFFRTLLREDVEQAIDGLPEEFRVVVVLCDVQGLSYAEIAEALELPLGTVKSRLSRGRSLLQKALWRQAQELGLRGAAAEPTAGK